MKRTRTESMWLTFLAIWSSLGIGVATGAGGVGMEAAGVAADMAG